MIALMLEVVGDSDAYVVCLSDPERVVGWCSEETSWREMPESVLITHSSWDPD